MMLHLHNLGSKLHRHNHVDDINQISSWIGNILHMPEMDTRELFKGLELRLTTHGLTLDGLIIFCNPCWTTSTSS